MIRPSTRAPLPLLGALLLLALAPAGPASGQPPDEPLESPRATTSQVVGLDAITITWWSPGVKERAIWGELVPYGQNWRAGANDKTTITFEGKVTIEDTELEPGTYGFYVLPVSADEWQLVLNRNATGSPNEFDASEDVVRSQWSTMSAV